MDYSNPWYYNGKVLQTEDTVGYVGMVYLLENTKNNKFYVGKKFFWKPKYRMVNKKKKKSIVESDWKDYYGSSKELLEDIETMGRDCIRRTVLHMCKTKTQCTYYEMKQQIDRRCLLREDSYNGFIGGKISGKYLESLE